MTRFTIDDVEVKEEEFKSRLEEEVRLYVEGTYDDLLDDSYEPYELFGITFYASQVLEKCDPVAYRLGMDDEVECQMEDVNYMLSRDNEVEVNGTTFKFEEAEE